MTKANRLIEFYRRSELAPAVKRADDALELIQRKMIEVEDELSGIPRQVPPPLPSGPSDGRMYPPLGDAPTTRTLPDGTKVIRTSGHRITLPAEGDIEIVNVRTNMIEFEKAGGKSK